MERSKFYKIIDDLTEGWYIDANSPVKGFWPTKTKPSTGPRRKVKKGEEVEPNTTNGCVQVLAWKKSCHMCVQCCKIAEGKREDINLRRGQITCSCGLKYPIINLETVK